MAKAKSAMAHPLHLTADERKLFDALPEKLKEGWEVREEKMKCNDSAEQRVLRAMFLRLEHPLFRELQKKAKECANEQEFMNLCTKIDITKVSYSDLAELFFVLGPEQMSHVVSRLFREADSDDDLNSVAALTVLRHVLLESYQSVS